MLGRLRTSVRECLTLYDKMGRHIFGHPRRIHIHGDPFRSRWWWPRSKYNMENWETLLQNSIQDVVRVRSTGQVDPWSDFFPSNENQCKT